MLLRCQWQQLVARISAAAFAQVTTFGKKGSLLLELQPDGAAAAGEHKSTTLDAVIGDLFSKLDAQPAPGHASGAAPCTGHNSTPIHAGNVVSTDGLVTLKLDRSQAKERAKLQRALQATSREAAAGGSDSVATMQPDTTSSDEGSSDAAQQLTVRVRS